MVVRTDKGRRVEPRRTFCGQEGEGSSIFRDFVRTSFMDGPLFETTLLSKNSVHVGLQLINIEQS